MVGAGRGVRFLGRGMVAIAVASGPPEALWADAVDLGPLKDNTLIETDDGSLSNALGNVFAGRVGFFGNFTRRRGLMAFDVASAVAAGSTITSVTLTLTIVTSAPGAGAQPVALHRVLADWGEGTSFSPGGMGDLSSPGDATWLHTFFDTTFWGTPGGDFDPSDSASINVGIMGAQTWGSTSGMVADVQAWLDDPASNFGWLLLGNEADVQTAKSFASRENFEPSIRPVLTVQFDPPQCPQDCGDGNGTVSTADLLALLAQWGGPGACDFDGNVVSTADLLLLLAAWGPCR